jgi:hypothetical protein
MCLTDSMVEKVIWVIVGLAVLSAIVTLAVHSAGSGGAVIVFPGLGLLLFGRKYLGESKQSKWHEGPRPLHDDPDAQPKHEKPVLSDWE